MGKNGGKTGKKRGKTGKTGEKRGKNGGEMGEDGNYDDWVKLLMSLALPLFFICIPLLMLLSSPHRYGEAIGIDRPTPHWAYQFCNEWFGATCATIEPLHRPPLLPRTSEKEQKEKKSREPQTPPQKQNSSSEARPGQGKGQGNPGARLKDFPGANRRPVNI